MTKIKKNDTVVNNIQLVFGNYPNFLVLPIGTELKVHKTTRTDTLYCSTVDPKLSARMYNTISVRTTDVTLVVKPLPTINTGDIFVCSWGYGQTNIDYYKVISVLNKSVVIAGMGQTRKYTGSMQGQCVPDPTKVDTKRITKRINSYGNKACLKINSFSTAFKWNGNADNFTEWN